MFKTVSIALMTSCLSLAAVSEAAAWTRNATTTGPRGTSNFSASGSCYGGTCSRSATRTGPYGNSATKTGSVTCDPSMGQCSHSSTTTGSNGGTINRQSTVTR